jgi:hypothetical protein
MAYNVPHHFNGCGLHPQAAHPYVNHSFNGYGLHPQASHLHVNHDFKGYGSYAQVAHSYVNHASNSAVGSRMPPGLMPSANGHGPKIFSEVEWKKLFDRAERAASFSGTDEFLSPNPNYVYPATPYVNQR